MTKTLLDLQSIRNSHKTLYVKHVSKYCHLGLWKASA